MPALPGKIRFASHARVVLTDQAKAAARRIRSSQSWRLARLQKLAENPLCEDPLGRHPGRVVPAAQVHHIRRLELAPHLAFTPSNLQSVCVECHSHLSAAERSPGSAN